MGAVVVFELVDAALLVLLGICADCVAVLVAAAFGMVVLDVDTCVVVGPGVVLDVLAAAVAFPDNVLDVPGAGAGVVVLDVLVAILVLLLLLDVPGARAGVVVLDVDVEAGQGMPSSFLQSADILAAFIPLFVGSQTAFAIAEIRPETQFDAVTQGVDLLCLQSYAREMGMLRE